MDKFRKIPLLTSDKHKSQTNLFYPLEMEKKKIHIKKQNKGKTETGTDRTHLSSPKNRTKPSSYNQNSD